MHQTQVDMKDLAKLALEEELEESNITDLRQALLPTIERMQDNPALRVLIRKHGVAQAVLISAKTYDLVKNLVNRLVQQTDAMSREERIEAALQRLEGEFPANAPASVRTAGHATAPCTSSEKKGARIILGEIQEKIRELHTALEP